MIDFDLAAHLPAQRPLAERWPFLALAVISSYTILYLAHIRGTRLIRLALWPVAPVAALSFWFTVDLRYSNGYRLDGSSTRWAFADQPPSYRPLPPTLAPWAVRIRNLTPIKAFNLIYIEARLVGLSDGPPFKSVRRGWLRGTLYQLSRTALYVIAIDLFSYPIYRLDPGNIGQPWSIGDSHDWAKGMATMAQQTGLPAWVVGVLMTLNYGWLIYLSMYCMWHMLAFVGCAMGLYADDEFPPLMDAPWMAQSQNELWGKRYHQSNFYLFTLPLAVLPPSYRIIRIFLGSAIYHQVIYYPMMGNFNFWPTMYMFMAPAVCCSAERIYKRLTGRRVGGWTGRIWMYISFIACMYPGVVSLGENGWISGLRNEIAGENSMVEQVLYKLGWGDEPVKNLAQGW